MKKKKFNKRFRREVNEGEEEPKGRAQGSPYLQEV